MTTFSFTVAHWDLPFYFIQPGFLGRHLTTRIAAMQDAEAKLGASSHDSAQISDFTVVFFYT